MTVPNDSEFIANTVTELQFKNALIILLSHIRQLTSDVVAAQGGKYGFASIAEFESVKSNIPAGSIIIIGEAGEHQGDNFWDGITLVKSPYDPLHQATLYTDTLFSENANSTKNLHLGLQQAVLAFLNYGTELKDLDTKNQAIIMQLVLAQQTIANVVATNKLQGSSSADVEATYSNNYIFGKPSGLIEINYETTQLPLPTAKGTVLQGQLTFNIDGQILHCYSTLEVQGSGSAVYAKKNWTFALYSDASFGNEINLSIGNTLLQQEWVFKANYTDKAQVRNLLNYNLWGKFLNARTGSFPVKDIDFSYLGLTGDVVQTNATSYPTGFNCVFNVNGEFYGIGQLMIGKKRENYNIPKNSPKKILIGLDNLTGFRTDTLADGTYELRAPSKVTTETTSCLNTWRAFAQSAQASFTASKNTYLHTANIVDFYIYSQFTGNIDGITNNTHMCTWDGVKWFFLPYDMDLTFKDFRMSADETNVFSYNSDNLEFWNKVRTAYKTEIAARWLELKAANIVSVPAMRQMYLDITNQFTQPLHAAELALYPNRETVSPHGGGEISTFNLQKFCDWVARRIVYCDSKFV
ncbi:MAG: CotH kinase family protein [Acinetobacter populi]|jgi:hypothetical protein|uniref:CotH kinase family protein n=1 Tax=Acinetobacter populi TaxID=1582270 RepID=UPI002354C8A1|nr:CotH kinase family protein [Acinetobacter populi]MCH4247584.1 CotH kinase family protein [Acinetobacter populi]